MNRQHPLTTWLRLVVATAFVLGVGVAINVARGDSIVVAANVAPTTKFVIDGDRLAPNDFADGYGPGPTPGGFPSTGLYYKQRSYDQNLVPTAQNPRPGCDIVSDPSTGAGGVKLGDGPVWPSPGSSDPNGKTDLNFIDLAAEKVNQNGEIFDILYVGYEKCGGTGTWQTALYLDDGDGTLPSAGDADGDYLFIFDFNPSSGDVLFKEYRRESGAWVLQASIGTFIDGKASGDYGEVALNITALLFTDDNGIESCNSAIIAGPAASITGGSLSSQVKDLVGFPNLRIDNCGDLSVAKAANGTATTDLFSYVISQADADGQQTGTGTVHSSNLTVAGLSAPATTLEPDANNEEIDASITVSQNHTWSNVISSPDYELEELTPLPAGWELDTIVCQSVDLFSADPFVLQPPVTIYDKDLGGYTGNEFLVAPATLGNDPLPQTTCTITNDVLGITIVKAGAPSDGTTFTFDISGGVGTDVPVVINGDSVFRTVPAVGTYTITEDDINALDVGDLEPDWSLESILCVDNVGAVAPVYGSDSATVVVDGADDDIVCTFTNNQTGRIIVEKVGAPAGSSFDFEHDIDGDTTGPADFSLAIPSTTGAGAFESGDIPAGVTYTITELLAAVNAGDAPDVEGSVSCTGETPVGTTTGDVTATVDLAPGEIVTCTFSNEQLGRIIVEKTTTNGDGTFTFDLPGTAGDGSITTVAGVGTTTLEVDVAAGQYDVSEAIPAGWDLTGVECSDGSGTLVNGEDSATVSGIDVGSGEVVTCVFTNTRETATLTLTKDWSADAFAGDSVELTATGNDSQTAGPATGDSTAPGTDNDAILTVYPGETVSLAEAYGTNTADYTASLSCDNGSAGTLTYTAGDLNGSFAVVGDDPEDVTCKFVNSRTAANLTLEKVWVDGFEGDIDRLLGPDTAVIDAGGSQNTSTVGEAAPASVTVPVLSGASVDLSESFGTNTGSYTTELECTAAGLTYDAGDLNGTYTMPAVAADVTCTFTNTRTSTDLTLTKSWTNPADGDSVDLAVVGEAGTATGANAGDASVTDDATLTVYSGEVVDLSEAFNPGEPTWYNTALECSAGALTYTAGALAAELEITSTDASIVCTFGNVRRTANVVVVKDVAPDSDGGLFDLSINGGSDVTDGGDGATSAPVQVFVGDPVTVSESAGTGTDLANYTSSLACPSVTLDSNTGTGGGFDVPDGLADGATITCTFTNTRKSATLTLTKDWVNGATGDAVSLTATGDSGNSVAALGSSSAPDADSDAVLTVWAGESVELAETYVPDNVGSYTAGLTCTDAAGLTYTGLDLFGTYAVPSTPVDVTCTFTNTRTSAELTLQKAWVDGASGDAADLDVTSQLGQSPAGGATSTANGTIGTFTDTTNVVTATVLSGEQVSLDELLADANLGSYDSELVCGTDTPIAGTSGTYTMPKTPAPVTCTFTNTRTRVDLTVDKTWVAAVAGDTSEITVTGDLGAPSSTSTALGGDNTETAVVTATVLSGETVDIAEVLGVDNTALYTSSLDCGDGAIGTTSGQITVAKDATADISCEFTNTAQRGTIVIVKNIDGTGNGTFPFDGDWSVDGTVIDPASVTSSDFSITTSGQTGTVTFTDVLVPNDGSPYTIIETDPGASFDGTSVSCVETGGDGGSGPVDGSALPLTGSIDLDNGEVVTCTFTNTEKSTIVIVKDAQPDSPVDFGFTGDLGAFSLDDDADPTLPNTKTSDLLNAEDGSTYTINETATPGWTLDLAASSCSNGDTFSGSGVVVDPAPGTTVTCTFVNTADPAGLTATKAVDGVVGDWGPFTFTLTGGSPTATFTGDADQDVDSAAPVAEWVDLVEGELYTLTENQVPGYETGAAFTCTVILPGGDGSPSGLFDASGDAGFQFYAVAGAVYSCDITNVAIPPTLVVDKTTVGGTGTFTFDVTPTNAAYPVGPLTADTSVTNPASTATVDLQAGVGYSVAERDEIGWIEGDLTCTVTPADGGGSVAYTGAITQPGDVISCDVENIRQARIIVEKTTVPAAAAGDFGFEATWNGAADGAADFTLGDGDAEDSGFIDPDITYTVTELDAPGFALTAVECRGGADATGSVANSNAVITPAPGEIVTCEFTNTQRGVVTIQKDAVTGISRVGTTYSVTYEITVANESYIDESFSLSDTPDMASNVTITSIVVDGPGVSALEISPVGGAIVTDGIIPARAGQGGLGDPDAFVYTVVTEFTMTPSNTNQECVADTALNGAYNGATVTFDEPPTTASDDACVDLPTPDIDVTKVAVEPVATQVGDTFQYQALYTVTVTNSGEGPGSYTISDLPSFGSGAVDSVTLNPLPGLTNVLEAGESDIYDVTVLFTVAGDLPLSLRECGAVPTPGQGGYNSVTVSYGPTPDPTDDACVEIPDPEITVSKVRTTDTATLVSGTTYRAVYTITVDNIGDGPGAYSVADLPDFGTGANIVSTTIVPEPVAFTAIEAGGQDVYTVTIDFTVDGDMALAERECAVDRDVAGQGAYNGVSVTWNDDAVVTDDDCIDIPDPEITVSKVRTTDTATLVGGNTYRAVYTITVDNVGDGPGAYSVADLPDFGTGANIVSTTIVPEPVASTAIEAGGQDVYTVTIDFTVDGDMALAERECAVDRDVAGQGAYNGVSVTWNDDAVVTDDDCIDIPRPNVDYSKIVVDDAAVYNGDNEWTVTYQIDVTNLDPSVEVNAGPAQYDLSDTFDFGPGVTVDGVTVIPSPDTLVVVPGFDGDAQNVLAQATLINRNETHTYTIVVDVTIVPTDGTNGDCTNDGGLNNAAGLSVATDPELAERADQEACASFSTLTLIKQLSEEDDGGNADIEDFTLTATLDGTEILSGTVFVTESVPAGAYVLAETQQPGYVSQGFVCGTAAMDGQTVTVPLGDNVVCTIVNDDLPVDLEIDKDDDGFTTLAGGDPVPYTISVRNVGTRDADLGEPVTVVDTLPAFMSWNTYPSNCTAVGQVLTCDIDPALMTVGGDAVVIEVLVDVAANAPSGALVNEVYVTTEDDPVCEPAGECEPPPCEEAANNNNVDCEPTEITRFATITIVKVDDVPGGEQVFPGDTYTYTLTVTNNGPSVILPGLTVDDDLPAQLDFVSAAGTNWTCNTADPIVCTYGPDLDPGETAPAITVTVRVDQLATGEFIENTAVATGFVERDCADVPNGLAEAISPCDPITDEDDEITPLQANADLAIVKTASVAQVGAGGSFNWTLVVTNNGPAPAVNVVVGDLVPAATRVTGVSSSFFDCSRSGNGVTCTVDTMDVGESGTVTIAVSVPSSAAAATVVNVGTVESDTPDPNLDNNSDDAEVVIVAQIPPVTVTPTIPPTGSDSTGPMVRTALLFVLLGALGVAATRRRRNDEVAPTA